MWLRLTENDGMAISFKVGHALKKRVIGRLSALFLVGLSLGWSRPARSQEGMKSPISGLVTMGKLEFIRNPEFVPDNTLKEANTHPKVYAGVVILAKWSQLEPA